MTARSEALCVGLLGGVFLTLAIVSVAWSLASQPPPPTKPVASQEPKNLPAKTAQQADSNAQSPETLVATINQGKTHPDHRPHAKQTDPQQQDSPRDWREYWRNPITYFTAVLMIVAILQWWLMRQQSGIMRDEMQATRLASRAAKNTVNEMRLDRRAWLTVDAKITRLDPGQPLGIDVLFQNSGRTPAVINKLRIKCGWAGPQLAYEKIIKHHRSDVPWETRENIVAPNATYTAHIQDLPIIDGDEIEGIEKETKDLFCIVTVVYSDFADGRETQVFLIYYPRQKRMQQYAEYNYMK